MSWVRRWYEVRQLTSDSDHILVTGRCLEMLKDSRRSVWLQILIIRHQLDDSVPDLGSNVVSGSRDELQDGVDIPFVLSDSISTLPSMALEPVVLTSVAKRSVRMAILSTISSRRL